MAISYYEEPMQAFPALLAPTHTILFSHRLFEKLSFWLLLIFQFTLEPVSFLMD